MRYTPKNMFWIRSKEGSVLTTTLDQWRDTDDDYWIEVVEATLQGLVSRVEMLKPSRRIFAGCLIKTTEQMVLDVESTLEFARWLSMSGRGAMMRVPLEASTLYLFDELPIEVLCIDPLWPHFGVDRIHRDVLKWFTGKTNKQLVLRIDPQIIHPEDVEWLRNEGWCLNAEVEVRS